jgi:hypothetical protein
MMALGLAKTAGSWSKDPELLEVMEGSCQRAAGLVKQLLASSRQSMLRPQSLDLAATVAPQLESLRSQLGEGIELKFTTPPSLGRINADAALMAQVLHDLCLNAREAMKRGGVLRVELGEEVIGVEREKTCLDARAGRFARADILTRRRGMAPPSQPGRAQPAPAAAPKERLKFFPLTPIPSRVANVGMQPAPEGARSQFPVSNMWPSNPH